MLQRTDHPHYDSIKVSDAKTEHTLGLSATEFDKSCSTLHVAPGCETMIPPIRAGD